MDKKFDKRRNKLTPEQLEQYMNLMSKNRTFKKKKGAGSYTRKEKHKRAPED